ncbi:MAG: ROK family protein, partial [Lachnospiraceae bacterium]|nr:ROK family protein [Lachnospiraceae bacterium]
HRCGELGHMTLVPHGRKCYCGQKGCVDSYCSALRLSDATNGNLHLFFERLEQNDSNCKKIWEEYLEYLCITIHNVNITMDCNILLGGYVGWYLGPYLEGIRKRVIALSGFETDGMFVQPTKYNENSSALGAALSFVKNFIEKI